MRQMADKIDNLQSTSSRPRIPLHTRPAGSSDEQLSPYCPAVARELGLLVSKCIYHIDSWFYTPLQPGAASAFKRSLIASALEEKFAEVF